MNPIFNFINNNLIDLIFIGGAVYGIVWAYPKYKIWKKKSQMKHDKIIAELEAKQLKERQSIEDKGENKE